MRTFLVALLWGSLGVAGALHAETLYFIHVDHLGTPRLAVGEDGVERWRWDQLEPFGDNVPIETMGTEGYPINLPLRFPGQYADKETGLAYNMARDYDSETGRYIQSDPIGLQGGLNSYAYVSGMPLRLIDPFGMQGESATSKERCPPNSCQKKCLESVFGESVGGIDVIVDPPMVTRHLGEGYRGSTTRQNTVYTNLGCGGFWSSHHHVLHEYFHVIRQWGSGMTEWSYLWNWRQKEKEADTFADGHLMEYIKCLSMCSPQCKP